MFEEFSNDDAGYVEWVRTHPRGYVVVSWNPPRAEYISLHRADCHCIDPAKATHIRNWTTSYVKICGETIPALEEWAVGQFGPTHQGLTPCGHCRKSGRL